MPAFPEDKLQQALVQAYFTAQARTSVQIDHLEKLSDEAPEIAALREFYKDASPEDVVTHHRAVIEIMLENLTVGFISTNLQTSAPRELLEGTKKLWEALENNLYPEKEPLPEIAHMMHLTHFSPSLLVDSRRAAFREDEVPTTKQILMGFVKDVLEGLPGMRMLPGGDNTLGSMLWSR